MRPKVRKTLPTKTKVVVKKNSQSSRSGLTSKDRISKRMLLSVSVFLLGREKMKDSYWTIRVCDYIFRENTLKVGVTTVDNKMGTVLKNMRSHASDLAHFLKDQGLTPKVSKIQFYVHKDEKKTQEDKLKDLIDTIEFDLSGRDQEI